MRQRQSRTVIDALRIAAGAAMVLVALVLFARVFDGKETKGRFIAVAADLPVGRVIAEEDLRETSIEGDAGLSDVLVAFAGKADVVGKRLVRNKLEGELLFRGDIAEELSDSYRGGVRVTVDRNGSSPDLRAGDSVEVIATFDKQSEVARSVVIASKANIVAIEVAGSPEADSGLGPLKPAESRGPLPSLEAVLDVEEDEILPVVFATHNGSISLVRSGSKQLRGSQIDGEDPIVAKAS
jgi:hypothetical protein